MFNGLLMAPLMPVPGQYLLTANKGLARHVSSDIVGRENCNRTAKKDANDGDDGCAADG